jgi:hypothetical protein
MISIQFSRNSLRAFTQYLNGLQNQVKDLVRAEIEDSMLKIESESAQNVPVDLGFLKNSIQSSPIIVNNNEIKGGVEVGAAYAPFVEFGTGTRVNVPSELNNFARQFKGNNIKAVNLPARPFFYPQVYIQKEELPRRIERSLQILLNRR